MSVQYWVGDFFIDLSRNQVTYDHQTQTVPPKALAVLTCLAKNVNQVVSQDELLTAVWPDTIVTPNTLQRSIAQLRKVLSANLESKAYIKTHAKQGYSLECEVRWQANITTPKLTKRSKQSANETHALAGGKERQKGNRSWRHIFAGFMLTLLFGVGIGLNSMGYFNGSKPFEFEVKELRSLTATDNKEYGGVYSADGQYVIFQRYPEKLCRSSIWAKHLETGRETPLMDKLGTYGEHSLSDDGKQLIYIEANDCTTPVTQKQCYTLQRLDVAKAFEGHNQPTQIMECKNTKIIKPTWLNDDQVLLMQLTDKRWKLILYSVSGNESQTIYDVLDGRFIDYDYSVKDNLIALIVLRNDHQRYLDIVRPSGELVSSQPVENIPEISPYRRISPNFTPDDEQLIFSTGRQLFGLTFDGQVSNISIPLDTSISTPTFHLNGQRALVVKGFYDSDIAMMALSNVHAENYVTLDRSTQFEHAAQFQPGGDLIAFQSNRSGEAQIWLYDGKGSQKLSNFPKDSYFNGIHWAQDGQSVLVNVNSELFRVLLDGSQKRIPMNDPIRELFQWNSKDDSALGLVNIDGQPMLVALNLRNSAYTIVSEKSVKWAQKSEDGRVIYTDLLDRFWITGSVEDTLIPPLMSQGSDKRFVITHNVIYGVNEASQLWSYDLNSTEFQVLGAVPKTIDYLTDVNHTNVLFSNHVASKKSLAELVLAAN